MRDLRGHPFFFKPINDSLWRDRFHLFHEGLPEHIKGMQPTESSVLLLPDRFLVLQRGGGAGLEYLYARHNVHGQLAESSLGGHAGEEEGR